MAGVSRQAVSAVEAGLSDPSLRVALALARALGLTVEEMFGPGTPAPEVGARPLAPLGDGGARVTLAADRRPVRRAAAGRRCGEQGRFRARRRRPGRRCPAGPGAARPVRPLSPPRPTLVVAGCDPAFPLLEAPLGLLDPPVSFAWWPCAQRGGAGAGRGAGWCTPPGAHLRGRSGEYNVGSARTAAAGRAPR